MQSYLTSFFQLTTPENTSLPSRNSLDEIDQGTLHSSSANRQLETAGIKQHKKCIDINMVQHNVESLNYQRLHEISRIAADNNIHVLTLQGTRWRNFGASIPTVTHKCFFQSCGTTASDAHAGNVIMVSNALLIGAATSTCYIDECRAFMVRVKSKFHDLSIISAIAPGEHSKSSTKAAFWSALSLAVVALPKRSYVLVGIDANGHLGKDCSPGVHDQCGGTKFTENGISLVDFACRNELIITNTMQNCQSPGWTWQGRQASEPQTKIDYILIRRKDFLSVSSNTGAAYDSPILRTGHPIDHIPVHISIRVKTIAARVGAHKAVSSLKYDKAELQKAVRTLQTIRSNAMQNNPDPVDADSSAKVDAY
jgi:exonuclease III